MRDEACEISASNWGQRNPRCKF